MPGTPTPTLGLTVPTVGGDVNAWGNELNGDLAIIDNLGDFPVLIVAASGVLVFSNVPETIILCYGGAAGIALTPPIGIPVGIQRSFLLKKMDATNGAIIINALVSTIDNAASYGLFNQFQYVRILWDGVQWDVIGNN